MVYFWVIHREVKNIFFPPLVFKVWILRRQIAMCFATVLAMTFSFFFSSFFVWRRGVFLRSFTLRSRTHLPLLVLNIWILAGSGRAVCKSFRSCATERERAHGKVCAVCRSLRSCAKHCNHKEFYDSVLFFFFFKNTYNLLCPSLSIIPRLDFPFHAALWLLKTLLAEEEEAIMWVIFVCFVPCHLFVNK